MFKKLNPGDFATFPITTIHHSPLYQRSLHDPNKVFVWYNNVEPITKENSKDKADKLREEGVKELITNKS